MNEILFLVLVELIGIFCLLFIIYRSFIKIDELEREKAKIFNEIESRIRFQADNVGFATPRIAIETMLNIIYIYRKELKKGE